MAKKKVRPVAPKFEKGDKKIEAKMSPKKKKAHEDGELKKYGLV